METSKDNTRGSQIVNGLIETNRLSKYDLDLDTPLHAFDDGGESLFVTSIREMVENAK